MAPGGLAVGPYSQSERIAVVVADVSLKAELYIDISSCFLHKRLASSRSVPSTIEEACGRAPLSKSFQVHRAGNRTSSRRYGFQLALT